MPFRETSRLIPSKAASMFSAEFSSLKRLRKNSIADVGSDETSLSG